MNTDREQNKSNMMKTEKNIYIYKQKNNKKSNPDTLDRINQTVKQSPPWATYLTDRFISLNSYLILVFGQSGINEMTKSNHNASKQKKINLNTHLVTVKAGFSL